mmetsp:Transcript_7240/g.10226  ORF Transcript_7240/g.10226 Transcript_7240/m.10226 type:complete len:633 (+) Transcript_7240:96-1994(+)
MEKKLRNASDSGDIEEVRRLLSEGININCADEEGFTPLHNATYYGHLDVVTILLDRGAQIDAATKDGFTPLMFGARKGHLKVVSVLLARGAFTEAVNKDGYTPLILAAWKGHVEVVSVLLARGANLEAANEDGFTSLTAAVAMGNLDMISVLLAKGANMESADKKGNTPLILASWKNLLNVVSLLLDKGAHLEAVDKNGNTSLHFAAREGRSEVLSFLLAKGAQILVVNKEGKTPLQLASERGHKDIVAELDRAMDPSKCADSSKLTTANSPAATIPTTSINDYGGDSDIRVFVNSVYDTAIGFINPQLNQAEIVDHCVRRFEASCYVTRSSLLEDCEHIKNDDLGLKEDKSIPIKLVNSIYRAIEGMRKSPSNAVTLPAFSLSSPADKTGRDAHLTEILSELPTANDINALTARLDSLNENAHHIPTLMALIPVVKKGREKFNFFRDEARLVFFCSVTFERVPCGKNGDGYKVDTLKPWVRKAIPILKVGLMLLQLSLSVPGAPLPLTGLANDLIDLATRNQFLTCTASILDQFEETVLGTAPETISKELNSIEFKRLSPTAVKEAIHNLKLNDGTTRSAYEAIAVFLKEADPTLEYIGLTKHVSKSGKVAWLKNDPQVVKIFMDMKTVYN